jgi:hypothetical protein
MSRKCFLFLVFGAALALPDRPWPARADEPDRPTAPADLTRLRPGVAQAEVRRLLGPPRRVARQILYKHYLEQWVYDGPDPLRIEFDCVRGQEPQILTVHAPTAPRP